MSFAMPTNPIRVIRRMLANWREEWIRTRAVRAIHRKRARAGLDRITEASLQHDREYAEMQNARLDETDNAELAVNGGRLVLTPIKRKAMLRGAK